MSSVPVVSKSNAISIEQILFSEIQAIIIKKPMVPCLGSVNER